jgi:hypothetical protein
MLRQRGVAAIEFAFIAMLMVVMLLGILVYWRAFQAQQSLTRAAGDGARTILGVVSAGMRDPCKAESQPWILARVQQTVTESLAKSGIPGITSQPPSIAWQSECTANGVATFELQYQLPPLLGGSGLLAEPSQLAEKSVVHFASLL